jgi:hypothetical protein
MMAASALNPYGGLIPIQGVPQTIQLISLQPIPVINWLTGNAAQDAKEIHSAIAGIGTNDSKLISIFSSRPREHLAAVKQIWDTQGHKHGIEKAIIGDTSGNYQKILLALLKPTMAVRLEILRDAVKGAGTAEKRVIDMICTASNWEINEMKRLWPDLVHSVETDISGNFKKVISRILHGSRNEFGQFSYEQAVAVADKLYSAGEKKLGTDDSTFIDIITTYPTHFLELVSKIYQSKHKHTLTKAIKNETSGAYRDALIACVKPWHKHWAARIFHAIKGAGTDDSVVTSMVTVYDKPHLQLIRRFFEEKRKKNLEKFIEGDISGNYGKLVTALLRI